MAVSLKTACCTRLRPRPSAGCSRPTTTTLMGASAATRRPPPAPASWARACRASRLTTTPPVGGSRGLRIGSARHLPCGACTPRTTRRTPCSPTEGTTRRWKQQARATHQQTWWCV
ncbi:hypothetical protein JYU34_020108 [Plutella xylostella]|uniref:Uncharacterized protein n=1 Tax=Plutella xylostella TaxID=51655 RepID=A0ABQ7PVY1_PLUXY|nr:hypothetical protein JYU34_020108 [Plutella xylostella]